MLNTRDLIINLCSPTDFDPKTVPKPDLILTLEDGSKQFIVKDFGYSADNKTVLVIEEYNDKKEPTQNEDKSNP